MIAEWLRKELGYTSICLIGDCGEISAKKIGEWFGFQNNKGWKTRLRGKLNQLVDSGILSSRRGLSKTGEKLYRIGPEGAPILLQSVALLRARRMEYEKKLSELARRCDRIDRLGTLLGKGS